MTDETMTATERLRALLNERGVEHLDMGGMTEFTNGGGRICRTYTRPEPLTVDVAMLAVLPEQAVEATLGRGECHPIISDNLNESEGTGDAWADCSACGHLLFVLTDPTSEQPNYCPNCGRRIVGVGE